MLDKVSLLTSYTFDFYGLFSRKFLKSKLPISGYYNSVFSKCKGLEKKYIIFDQLNSLYAKYYSKLEATTLLNRSGFIDVELFHRHGYSCTALAKNSKFYFSIGTLVGNGIKRIFT